MFIHRVNIFLLSTFIAIAPASAIVFIPPLVMGVSAIVVGAVASTVLINNTSAGAPQSAAASYQLPNEVTGIGVLAAALIASSATAYTVGSKLSNPFGISDAISAALLTAGYTITGGNVKKPAPLDGSQLNPTNVEIVWSVPIQPASYFATPEGSCKAEAARQGRIYASYYQGSTANMIHCKSDSGYGYSNTYRYTNPNYISGSSPEPIPVTPAELGSAIAASPEAVKQTQATAAMQNAISNTQDVQNCYKVGGTYDLNSKTCSGGVSSITGQPLSGLTDAQKDAKAAEISAARTAAYNAASAQIEADIAANDAIADALANPNDQAKQDAKNAAVNAAAAAATKSANADAKLTSVSTAATAEGFSTPVFCTWAVIVCDAIAWAKSEPEAPTDTEISVNSSMPSSVAAVDLNREYFNFSNQCPPDIPLNFNLMGQNVTASITYAHFCTFLTALKPFVIASAFIGAVYIVSGSNRAGGGD